MRIGPTQRAWKCSIALWTTVPGPRLSRRIRASGATWPLDMQQRCRPWPQRNGVPDEVLATVAPSTERVSSRRRRQASLWATLVAMPFNESRRDLSPECDEAESSSVRGYRGPHCPSGHRPRHVLARQKNQMMLEVDASEEAKQVALYRMNSPASCTTTMRSSISSTTRTDRRLCGSSLRAVLVGPEHYREGCDS